MLNIWGLFQTILFRGKYILIKSAISFQECVAFKLRHHIPLFTLKLIKTNSSILHNELGRASKYHLYRIKVLQSRFLRASLFRKSGCPINVLYSTFCVLKLDDVIDAEHVKFLFRFNNNNVLPDYFKNYFVKLETIHIIIHVIHIIITLKQNHSHYHTRQIPKKDFFHAFARTEWVRKMVQRKGLNLGKKIL